ncbi:MAG TPA: glycosyltransferase 87 family protein, partial [Bradyrhizobium sp.]|nr:glycosyltransferase 87 family protein [Bradyrhizobium sp.]
MPRAVTGEFGRRVRFADDAPPLYLLAGIGAVLFSLTLVTPFAFENGGDNAFIALTIFAGLLTIAATHLAERAPPNRALWLIFSLGIILRAYVLLFDPLLSSDIYRYVWDGRVQAAGINPYRYFPADQALAFLRDGAIFPHINRAATAVTIYPPVAQFFFLIVTRVGESVTVMRLALLGCEAVTVTLIMLLLRRMNRPVTRVIAYLWHPLPLWEIANSGHVDALMVALMLLGLWTALTGHALRGAVVIALSVLVKPLAAPVLAGIWRQWDLKVPLAVIAVVALCYLPYLSVGWGVLGFLTKGYLTEEGISAGNDLWL